MELTSTFVFHKEQPCIFVFEIYRHSPSEFIGKSLVQWRLFHKNIIQKQTTQFKEKPTSLDVVCYICLRISISNNSNILIFRENKFA